MKIFLTGGSGFVGGAILSELKDHHEFSALARSEKSRQKVDEAGAIPVAGDLLSLKAEDIQGAEVVIHSAAYVEPYGPKELFYQVNVEGTQHLLKVAKEAGVRRFIFIGTEAALFDGSDLINIDESTPYPKSSPFLYSQTKKLAEEAVLTANEPGVFETLSLRPRMVWGPGDTTLLPNLIEMVKTGKFRWISGGQKKTSTTYIFNFTHAIGLALEKGRGGEAYFVVDGPPLTFKDFFTSWINAGGQHQIPERSVPGGLIRTVAWFAEGTWNLLGLKGQPPLARFSAAIMSAECSIRSDKAEKDLAYVPPYSVEEGMEALKKSLAT